MITPSEEITYEFRGLSTDKKPVNKYIGNGSTYMELDTGKVYFFDKEKMAWTAL